MKFTLRLAAFVVICSFVVPMTVHAALSDSLISYWSFDEASGDRADSVVASANNLTDHSAGAGQYGPSGVVATFYQPSFTASLSSSDTIVPGGSDWAVAVWYQDSAQATTGIIGDGETQFDTAGFNVYSNTNSTVARVRDGVAAVEISFPAANRVWHFGYLQYVSSTRTVSFSIDNGTPLTGTLGSDYVPYNDFAIGAAGGLYLTGSVSDAGVWSRVLTPTERTSLYNSGNAKAYAALSAGEKTGLVSYWNLDELSGTRVDSVGAHDLSDVKGQVTGRTASHSAKHNAAGVMASNQYLSATGSDFAFTDSDFSITGWFNTGGTCGAAFISKGNYNNDGWNLDCEGAPNYFNMYFGSLGDYAVTNTNHTVIPNTWTFFAFTYNKTTKTASLGANGGTMNSAVVAANPDATTSDFGFNMPLLEPDAIKIDEVGIWNRVLAPSEISELYNSGDGLTYADITATPTPTPTPSSGGSACSGTLSVGVSVSGGSATVADVVLFLDSAGMSRDSTYTISCGAHVVSSTTLSGYTRTWSGDCASDGSVSVDRDIPRTCTAVYTYSSPAGGGGGSTPTPLPSATPSPVPSGAGSLSAAGLHEGDTVSAAGSSDPDIYIVNIFGYKRLFLNPVIFNFYGHLGGFANVKTITAPVRDSFGTSGLFRNCETNDNAVYAVQVTGEDTGILHHVDITGDAAVSQDPDFFKKVFCINTNEFNWYTKGTPYTSLSEIPVYRR